MSALKKTLGIISTCDQIHNSPLNLSQTKQLYSFPKASRFKNTSPSYCNSAYYQLPCMKSKRKAAFGYGLKYDFTKQNTRTPAPNAYKQLNGSLDDHIWMPGSSLVRGPTFGLARETMKEGGFIKIKKNPGPGTYEYKKGLSDICYSMRPKTSNPCNIFDQFEFVYEEDNTSNKRTPGPGAYNHVQTIQKSGKYAISKYQCYGVTAFNPPSSVKYSESNKDLKKFPGPGTYDPKLGLSDSGKYFFSKFEASGCRIFPRYKRLYFGDRKDNYPGPGTYEASSEFGHYDLPQGANLSLQKINSSLNN